MKKCFISVRCNSKQKSYLQAKAALQGLTLSDYVLRALEIDNIKTDEEEVQDMIHSICLNLDDMDD